MTIQIIKIITFLTTAPLITLVQKGRYREGEYYNNLQGAETAREDLEKIFYETDLFLEKFGEDSEQATEERKKRSLFVLANKSHFGSSNRWNHRFSTFFSLVADKNCFF